MFVYVIGRSGSKDGIVGFMHSNRSSSFSLSNDSIKSSVQPSFCNCIDSFYVDQARMVFLHEIDRHNLYLVHDFYNGHGWQYGVPFSRFFHIVCEPNSFPIAFYWHFSSYLQLFHSFRYPRLIMWSWLACVIASPLSISLQRRQWRASFRSRCISGCWRRKRRAVWSWTALAHHPQLARYRLFLRNKVAVVWGVDKKSMQYRNQRRKTRVSRERDVGIGLFMTRVDKLGM